VFAPLEADPESTISNASLAAGMPRKNRETILHFDLYPTILESLGADVVGGRLALGYSAFDKPEALPPPGRLAEMRDSLLNRSDAYLRLWRN
jgi:phosphoglycerol transferase